MMKVGAFVLCAVVWAGGAKTVWDGVYTSDQANRGQSAYGEKCASCHGQDLEGTQGSAVEVDGSPLVGPSFIENWREDNLGELHNFIRNNMPREAAATVSDGEKLDILAFILRSNDFPAGRAELKAETVADIMMVGKAGPQPLPNMTAVRLVGCLTGSAPNAWTLNQASEPSRTRNPDESSPEELKASAAQALGTLTFKLPSLEFAIPGVKPADLKGHKVQIKGVLYRQTNNDRINVTAISSLSPSCAP